MGISSAISLKPRNANGQGVISAAGGLGLSQLLQETEKPNNSKNPACPVGGNIVLGSILSKKTDVLSSDLSISLAHLEMYTM
jgi:hypothetical protein